MRVASRPADIGSQELGRTFSFAAAGAVALSCNDYEQRVAWSEYRKAMQKLKLGIPAEQLEANLPQADDIRIHEIGPVMRVAGNGVELVPMTFGLPSISPRGGPVFNFKSEGRRFERATAA
jgi:hypothetical protein